MMRTPIAVAISVAATLLVLLVAEVAVRLWGIQPQSWPAIDGSTFFEGIEVDPLLGPLPRANFDGHWFDLFEAKFDAHRFRLTGYPPVASPRASIAFLGDSCTFGWGLGTAETFVAQLDARQRMEGEAQFRLLNAGYPGQSAVVGEATLRERVLPLHPDVVVLGFSSNNAFRFSLVADRERFRYFAARKLLLRSRLYHIAAAWLANRNAARRDPKERTALSVSMPTALARVAPPSDFAAALQRMIAEARAGGARVIFLLLPRASLVSTQFVWEDPTRPPPLPQRAANAPMTKRELGVLEASCLEPSQLEDPLRTLHERRSGWLPVYPADDATRALLRAGARAYVRGDYPTALARFNEAAAQQPLSPLALYDRGLARLASGDAHGIDDLHEADRLSCNVFLHYLVTAWDVARALDVPVVDIGMHFQAVEQTADDPLFLDPAHPTATGHRLIADALWPALAEVLR